MEKFKDIALSMVGVSKYAGANPSYIRDLTIKQGRDKYKVLKEIIERNCDNIDREYKAALKNE